MSNNNKLHNNVYQKKWASKDWFRFHACEDKENPSSYFNYITNGYQVYRHNKILNFLVEHKTLINHTAMLDIGCAQGYLTYKISKALKFKRTVGLDFIEILLNEGQQLFPNIEFCYGALPFLPFKNETFDLVVASEVIYYLNNEGRRKALREIYRVMKKGGIFLFTSVLGREYFYWDDTFKYISSKFRVIKYYSDNLKLYFFLIKPFFLALRLLEINESKSASKIEKQKKYYQKLYYIIQNPYLLFPYKLFCQFICRSVIRSSSLPQIFNQIFSLFHCKIFRNNIVILSQKE